MAEILLKIARRVRHATLSGIRTIGGFEKIAKSQWRRRQLLILCYHGVSLQDEHEWHPELFMTPEFLRHRFDFLRKNSYVVLPLDEAIKRLRNDTLPARSVALTFDDGFYNFYAAALPLLEEFGYPSTVYLTSYHCLHQRPILGLTLRYLLWRAPEQVLPPYKLPGQEAEVDLRDSRKREQFTLFLLDEARKLSGDREAQQLWLSQLANLLGVDWNNIINNRLFHIMSESEITNIAGRGIDIQLHTHRHKTPRDEASFINEVKENRLYIENLTGAPAMHFCYPSGVTDSMFLPWLRDLNVVTATTCATGLAKANHDPLLLPRFIDTMAQTDVLFDAWLSGTAELIKWRKS